MKLAVQGTSSSVLMVSAYQQNGSVMVMKTANLGMMKKNVNQVRWLNWSLWYPEKKKNPTVSIKEQDEKYDGKHELASHLIID